MRSFLLRSLLLFAPGPGDGRYQRGAGRAGAHGCRKQAAARRYGDAAGGAPRRSAVRGRRASNRKRRGIVSVLPGQGDRYAGAIGRSAVGREAAQGEDRQNFRTAGARLHVAANVARRGREPAALRRHHDARHQQIRSAADAARQAARRRAGRDRCLRRGAGRESQRSGGAGQRGGRFREP